MNITNDKYLPGHVAILISNLIFGFNLPVSKMLLSLNHVTSFSLNFLRMVGGAALFWLVSLFVKGEKIARKDFLLLFLASFFGIQLNQISFLKGLSMTAPLDASIITTVGPILTMIIAAFYLKEPITWKKVIGVLIGASGAIILILSTNREGNASHLAGNLLCLLSSASYAFYLVVFRGLIGRYKPVTIMKWMFLFAAICTMPLTWPDVRTLPWREFSGGAMAQITYIVVGSTFLAYLLIPIGQRVLRPTVVSMYSYTQPLVAAIAAIAIGIDHFTWEKGLSGILVFLGVYVVTLSKSRAQVEQHGA